MFKIKGTSITPGSCILLPRDLQDFAPMQLIIHMSMHQGFVYQNQFKVFEFLCCNIFGKFWTNVVDPVLHHNQNTKCKGVSFYPSSGT